ncbi:MAG: hypothetical protein IIC84_05690 [Chloroflexi bacterium]|nr:hypothetical protein [Chloroflexota bacterium]
MNGPVSVFEGKLVSINEDKLLIEKWSSQAVERFGGGEVVEYEADWDTLTDAGVTEYITTERWARFWLEKFGQWTVVNDKVVVVKETD